MCVENTIHSTRDNHSERETYTERRRKSPRNRGRAEGAGAGERALEGVVQEGNVWKDKGMQDVKKYSYMFRYVIYM